MKNEEKIIEMANKNNGYVTAKEVRKENINSATITRLIKKNKIEKISRGFYCLPSECSDDFYKYQLKSSKGIFSNATALYFHDLSDRTPLVFDITVPQGYNGSLRKDKNVILHYVKKK